MARSREFDDDEAVRAARGVFWEHGYGGASLAQLEAATGLGRSSLYAAYGSKRGLFERAAQSYLSEVMGPLLEPLEADGAGRDELAAYFLALGDWIRDSLTDVTRRGCMMVNTAVEVNDLDADAATMVRTFSQRIRMAIFHCVSCIGTVADPGRTADLLASAQLGIMVTARIDPQTAAELVDAMADDVRSW